MSIQTNSPSTNLGTSVSADEIAVLLGYADAAEMVAAISAGGNPALADISDWPSGLSATELGYVNGVTSAIQTQLDANAAACKVARFSRITNDQGSLSGSYARNIVAYNEETQDDASEWSNSSGTLTYSGTTGKVHDISINTTYMGAEGVFILAHSTDGGSTWNGLCMRWYTGAGSGMVGTMSTLGIALTNGDKLRTEFYSSAAASVLSYRQQSLSTYIPSGRANCITIVRRT